MGFTSTPKRKKKINEPSPYKYSNSFTETHRKPVYGAAFNPYTEHLEKGYFLATCGSRFLNIYRLHLDDKRIEHMMQFQDPHKDEGYYAVTWAYDRIIKRHVVLVGGANGIIRVIDPIAKTTINTLSGHGEAVNELRTSPADSMIVVSASKDRTARLWNVRGSDCLAIFGGACGHLDEVISLDIDLDQNYLLTASMDHTVRLWDIRPESGAGKRIAETHNRENVKSEPAEEVHFPLAVARDVHTNYVDCCRFLGGFIISKSCEDRIFLWKFGSFDLDAPGEGTIIQTDTYVLHTAFMDLPNAETWFIKFDLHPENKFLACGNETGEIHIWRMDHKDGFPDEKSDFVLTSPGDLSYVRQIVFSPCGQILIAVGENGQITRFDSTESSH